MKLNFTLFALALGAVLNMGLSYAAVSYFGALLTAIAFILVVIQIKCAKHPVQQFS